MLRRAILGYAILQLGLATVLFVQFHVATLVFAYLAVNAVVIIAALALERRRYRPAVSRAEGHWELTDERFIDATTGRLMAVRYNPQTGQRDYEEVTPQP